MTAEDKAALETLENRIRKILPEEYQDSYEDVQPVSMGSAALKFADDGRVAWDEIWGSFCDLAMAGGPPHKGSLLQPGSKEEIEIRPDRYRQVVQEICRGIGMISDFEASASPVPGWVRMNVLSHSMAEWLVRAIVMENVSAHWEDSTIDLPAGPAYRVEKEIKNVITVVAKTCHYWLDHMGMGQHIEVGNLFLRIAAESPLIQPACLGYGFKLESHCELRDKMADAIYQRIGLRKADDRSPGWLGLDCPNVRAAIWMMRALVASNVLSRREGSTVFVPVNPAVDPAGERVMHAVCRVHRFAKARSVLS